MEHLTEAFTYLIACQPHIYNMGVNEEGYDTFVKDRSTVIAYDPGSQWKIINYKPLINLCDEYQLRSFSPYLPLGEAMILEIARKVNTCTLGISDLSVDFDTTEPDPTDIENWNYRAVYNGDWVEVLFEGQTLPLTGRVYVECKKYDETLIFEDLNNGNKFNLEKERTTQWRKLFPEEIKKLKK